MANNGKIEKGENSASIAMKLQISNIVKRYSGAAQQKNGFWLMHQALLGKLIPEFWISEFEKDFPSKGKEIYDEMVQHYAKTNIQQNLEFKAKEEAKKVRKDVRKEAEITIAKRNLEHWKKMYAENPIPVFAKRVHEAEDALIRLGEKVSEA